MVDRDLVLRKIADLDLYLQQLEGYRAIDVESYRADWKTQRIVERTLHLAIEVCMDLAEHVVADRRLPQPDTGAATFEILGREGILVPELAQALGRMVGFRNILVHDYTRLDPVIVMRVLRTDTADLARFRDAVLRVV